jgi:GNAT superfamily N-acetyltransferase
MTSRDAPYQSKAQRLLAYLKNVVYTRFGIKAYQCLQLSWQSASAAVDARISNADIRTIGADEIQIHARDPELEISSDFLTRFAKRNDLCVGVFRSGRLVSYAFFASQTTLVHDQIKFAFDYGWIYVYKAFTVPAWRGKGLHQLCFQQAVLLSRNWKARPHLPKGYVALVEPSNTASLTAFKKLGFGILDGQLRHHPLSRRRASRDRSTPINCFALTT